MKVKDAPVWEEALNTREDGYCGIWCAIRADGNPFKPSESRLYFANDAKDRVWALPDKIDGEVGKPRLVTSKGDDGK